MLQYTQFLIFEIGSACNLAQKHIVCPSKYREKGSYILDDDKIVELAEKAYKGLGFTGLIGFHYYNEPMLYYPRIFTLIRRIREKVPESRFILWTNGTILIDDKKFDDIEFVVVTDYENKGESLYKKYYRNRLQVTGVNFDNRLSYEGHGSSAPCLRPFVEFNIDTFGEVHLCCQDWEPKIKIGNVYEKSFEELLKIKEEISLTISKTISIDNEICYKCSNRTGLPDFDPETKKRAHEFLNL